MKNVKCCPQCNYIITDFEIHIGQVREALTGTEASAIRSASEKLNEAWEAVSAELYKVAAEKARAAKAQAGPEPAKGETGKRDSDKKDEGPIIDAEVVDERK